MCSSDLSIIVMQHSFEKSFSLPSPTCFEWTAIKPQEGVFSPRLLSKEYLKIKIKRRMRLRRHSIPLINNILLQKRRRPRSHHLYSWLVSTHAPPCFFIWLMLASSENHIAFSAYISLCSSFPFHFYQY